MRRRYLLMTVLLLIGINSFPQTITIQSKTDVPEGAVSAALTMTGFGNKVSAFQWTITYDPAVLTFTGATDWFSGVGGVGVYTPESGKITFVWGDSPVVIEGVLCKLNFTASGQGCSDLTWSDNPTPRLVADGTANYNEYSVSYVNGQICKTVTSSDDYMLNRSSFMIYPTFAKEKITITYTFPEDGKIIVLFYDLNGDEIIKTDHIIVANYTTKQEISTTVLSPGIYFIKYLIKSGSINIVKVEKIFVSR